jgi:hypothetical protein
MPAMPAIEGGGMRSDSGSSDNDEGSIAEVGYFLVMDEAAGPGPGAGVASGKDCIAGGGDGQWCMVSSYIVTNSLANLQKVQSHFLEYKEALKNVGLVLKLKMEVFED